MCEDSTLGLIAIQEDEVELIKAMYPGDLEVEEGRKHPRFTILLHPKRGSSAGTTIDLENITFAKLIITFPPRYPKVIPKVEVKEYKGLSAQEIEEMTGEMRKKAEESVGEVMMHNLLNLAEEFLYGHQKKPVGSFHDEMIIGQRLTQERNIQMQMLIRERERRAIREEVLKKQEEIQKEEIRLRHQQRILQTSPSPPETETSPSKDFSSQFSMNRRKRRSISSRRRRSNSEGSDSSLSESSDLHLVEFNWGKIQQQFYMGEALGKSCRGNTVYCGISKGGSLAAIYEWKFTLPIASRRHRRFSGGATTNLAENVTIDSLTKQLQSFELEMNYFTKLEHSNTIFYHGMKIFVPDENGIVYLYLVEEFVRGFTVKSYLQDHHQLCIMALPLLRHIASETLEALRFLHDNNIAHRFLRDTSIFLDNSGRVKLLDYGIERKVSELFKSVHQLPDPPEQFPPSVGRGGKKGDIYRFGLILLSLLKGRYVEGPDIPQTFPVELQDFLRRSLSTLENNRWTAHELLDHPFIKMSINKGPQIIPDKKKDENEESEDNEKIPQRMIHSAMSSIPFSGHSRLRNEFEVLEWLGKGGFGDVLKVRNKLDGRIYALKRIKLNPRNKQLNKKITREVKLLSQLNHENVVRYFNSWIETVEEDDTETTSEGTETGGITSSPKKVKEPSVRFRIEKKDQNSLGLLDNIEELAPEAKGDESNWSVSFKDSRGDSDSSDDELDLFGTSFLRLGNEESEDGVIFEDSFKEGASETDTGEASLSQSFHKPFQKIEVGLSKEEGEVAVRETQYMYIQMEFCEKSTLRTAIDEDLCDDVDRAWRLFREIVEGLVHIHQQGMIHRDLKPVNIFLDSNDHVKIGDFGLATSSILPKFSAGESFHEKADHQQSVDFPEESQTGQVGTALYVAPELIKGCRITYNQKVDIYSLGIIFFEMFSKPSPTSMERVRVISSLRLPDISFPSDYDEHFLPQVTHITKWLLNHDPSYRPTSLELLQSDYLPPPHLEEAELRDIFSRTLKNSQSKAYKFLIASCFLQGVSAVEDYTFDMESTRFPPTGSNLKCINFCHKLKQTIQKIFECHGGLEIGTPILLPKSGVYEENESCVKLMSHSGNLVCLPHDLRIPFARYVGRYGIRHVKRYAIEKVFRERKVFGLHPRELVECAFDIVDCTPGSLITDAEVLSICMEIVGELPWLRNKQCTIRLGHTKLLEGLLLHHGIDKKFHNPIKKTLAEIKMESASSKVQIQTYLCSRGLPEHFITMLFALMEVEGTLGKVGAVMKSVLKRKGEAASLIKAGLHELEVVMNHLGHLGLKCGVVIAPTMVFGSNIYGGLLYQVVCNLRRRKNKMMVDVIAAGGRYDELIEEFRASLGLEADVAAGNKELLSQCGVGISISFDKLIAGYGDGEDCNEWDKKGTVDAVICSAGHYPLSKEKLELMKELWAHGIKCSVFECSQTLEEAEEQCKESGAQFILILKDTEFYSTLRVKMWEKGMFRECKMSRAEAIEMISRRVNVNGYQSQNELGQIPSSTGLCRSDSVVGGKLLSNETRENLVQNVNLTFVVQEREKLASWKKRYENQVMHHITDVLPKFAKSQLVEVVGIDVNVNVVNTLASCLVSDKEEFHRGVGDVVEKHPRLRKYLQNICDEIYDLWFEKSANVIVIYGLIDNSYRVML